MEMEEKQNDKVSPVEAELYFLMYKFLSGGPLERTLKVFQEELTEHKLLPKRNDWFGAKHERNIEDFHHQHPFTRPDYLLQLCCRAGTSSAAPKNVVSLFTLKKNHRNIDYNFKQLLSFVWRRHHLPGREISGAFSRKYAITPKLYGALQLQRRTLGHLSAVYCLLFDYSGRYIITGADDLLIKLWSAQTGRLIASFRGASSEITDIAINVDNTLLAAGSIDRILRVWDLQTGVPVAVLSGHTGMITSVNFCPSPFWSFQYLITTSTDGSVAFWAYTYDSGGKVDFRTKPTMYQEKMRPGQAQMICSSFSPGGTFLATGSADHHVRVYYMKGDEGPHRILETEAHNDRVDSIQWAHSGLRFLSGSKDGTAIIWTFQTQQWKTLYLQMNANKNATKKAVGEEAKKFKVTMVTWDRSDEIVITSVSDHTLRTWNSTTGLLEKTLTGHTDEIYVLECHPHESHMVLSAGHDGQLFIWDLARGEIISRFTNTIENQGFGAFFDIKWSPDGTVLAASDSHGNLLIFGFGNGSKIFEYLPKDLFFHTDFRPLMRDVNNHVLDEQTQIPPHLMPPPFLVDIDGNPYPPMLQRMVPGRELCNTEQLVPNIVIGNEGRQEVIQEVSRGMNRHEGLRQSTGDWQSDPNMKWKRNVLVRPLSEAQLRRIKEDVESMEAYEVQEYRRQLCQRPHMISTASFNDSVKSSDKKKSTSYQTRPVKARRAAPIPVVPSSSSESEASDSTGHSDWEDFNPEALKRSTRRRRNNDDSETEDEEADEEEEEEVVKTERKPNRGRGSPESQEAAPKLASVTRLNHLKNEQILDVQRTTEWLTETKPKKTPYFPQMGDQIVYFPQGHHLYLDMVRNKKIYESNSKTLPWSKLTLRGHEFVKIVGIQYEVKPPRLCSLRLALLDDDCRLTGKLFTVKYHDMPDVLDFFVLKQNFDIAMARNWKEGDKFRCMIDDGWWIGEIVAKSTASEDFPGSPFLCYEIKWDNGEQERMSPWDMEPLDDNRLPENPGEALPVLEEEIQGILYQPSPDDWPNNNREAVTSYVLTGLSKVMQLAIAEPFLVPVDINVYPTYAHIVEYPIDLATIKARFENNFYRRVTAAQFDIRHLATNAEKFNQRHSVIVKHARILTELCLRIVKQCTTHLDVNTVYHQLVDTYDSTDTEVDVEVLPSGSRMLRSIPPRFLKHPNEWKAEAKTLFQAIWDCEDSVPFQTPVNTLRYTDYNDLIETPMDLSTVKDKLFTDIYETPHQFYNDMRLIFTNSRTYNTNKRSRIYVMTVRLAAMFEEHINKLITNWKRAKRRSYPVESKKESGTSTEEESSSEHSEAVKEESDSDSSEDNTPLMRLQTRVSRIVSDDEEEETPRAKKRSQINSSDSEESYKPTQSSRKRFKSSTSSSSSGSSDNDSSDNQPLSALNGRTARKRLKSQPVRYTDGDSEDEQTDNFLTSVSSRGRLRKLNPRVTALMKK